MIRARIAASLLLLAFSAAAEEPPSGPPAVTAHSLEVVLDPATGSLEATDRMTVRRNRGGTVYLELRSDLDVRLLEVDERVQPAIVKEDVDPRPGIARYRVPVNPHPGENASLVVSYRGTIREDVKKASDLAFVSGDRLSGTIGPDGVFLADSTGWVPLDGSMATFSAVVTVPEGWMVVSQGGIPGEGERSGKAVYTIPAGIPYDGLWLQAGKWKVERRKEKGGVVLGTFLSEANAPHSKLILDALEEYLAFYRDLLGPYPHSKFDVVENFFTTGYGMPTATLLGGDVIAHMAATAGRSDGKIPAGYLDHELVHSWWGNGVFVEYASGNWCEGLTTYCSNYLRKERESAEEAAKHRRGVRARFAARVRPDRDYALRDFQGKTEDVDNDIGYGKASMLCHMARRAAGDEAFFNALRDFSREFAGKRAGWDDLRRAIEKRGGRNLEGMFAQMLERPGAPVLVLDGCAAEAAEGGFRVTGRVLQREPAPWALTVPLVVETTSGSETTSLDLSEAETGFTIRTKDLPLRVLLDPDSHVWRGYAPGEVPPTLDATLSDPGGVVCYAPHPSVGAPYAPVVEAVRGKGVAVKESAEDGSFPGEPAGPASVLVLGHLVQNETLASLLARTDPPVVLEEGGVSVAGRRFKGDDVALLASLRHPVDPARFMTVYGGFSDAALSAARRVFFYGGDGIVVFQAGRPVLRLEAAGEESSRARLLDGLLPGPDAERAGALVDWLCVPQLEGRLAGSTGDGTVREALGKALEGMGLAPVVQPFTVETTRWDGETPCIGIGEGEPAPGPAKGVPFLFSPAITEWRRVTPLLVEESATPESFLAALHDVLEKGAEGVLVVGPERPPKALADYLLLPPKPREEGKEGPVLHPAMEDAARRARLLLPGYEVKVPVVYHGKEPSVSWLPTVVRCPVAVDRQESGNVLAVIPGSDPALAGEAVLLGAHHDGQGPGFPSANDNASGVAAVLEAARTILGAKASLRRPVVIALFGAEEWGLRGSQALIAHPPEGLPRIVAALNLDAVGDPHTPAVHVVGEGVHKALGVLAARCLEGAGLPKGADIDRHAFAWGSDHYSFHRAGIPAVDFFSMEYRMMHTPEDGPERVSGAKIAPVARAAAAFAIAVSRGGPPK